MILRLFFKGPTLLENSMKFAQTVILAALIVMGLGCGYSKPSNMPVGPGTTPTIVSLSPTSATAGAMVNPLTVNGTSFNLDAVVNFNGAAMTTKYVSSTQLTATVPASATMTAGTAQVTVTNPGKPGGVYGGGTMAQTSNPPTPFTIN
jgi:uncharacterized protein (TIGR03437 family)